MNFGQNPEILGLHFWANMELRTQPAILVNFLKIIGMSFTYENCNRFKVHDVTLAKISGAVFTFSSSYN